MVKLEATQLVPPLDLLRAYAVTAEQFTEHGYGFLHEFLVKRARLQPNEKVLDLGCGPGHHARALVEYLTIDGSFDGLDISQSSISYCQSAYAEFQNFAFQHADIFNAHYNPTSTLRQADYRLPYDDNRFDLVYAVSLFTHLMPDDTVAYFREIRRVLKPSGRFAASFFLLTEEALSNLSNPAHPTLFRFPYEHGNIRVMSLNDLSEAVAYPELWIRRILNENGFRVVETTYGTWSGERDLLQALQDIVMAVPRINAARAASTSLLSTIAQATIAAMRSMRLSLKASWDGRRRKTLKQVSEKL